MDDLAARANCSNSTIRDFEARRREPHKNRLQGIRQALEVAGIVFSEAASGEAAMVSGPVTKITAAAVAVPKKKTLGRTSRPSGTKRKSKQRAS
jgi:transcriptional regulator with XRE-family HTH domain